MTKSEYKKKYPIGTNVRYIGSEFARKRGGCDIGMRGKIVGYVCDYPLIFLPDSAHISGFSTHQVPVTWQVGWDSLEMLAKNEQLLFDFAYEGK